MYARPSCVVVVRIFVGSVCISMRIAGGIRRPKRARSPIREPVGSNVVNGELGGYDIYPSSRFAATF